ncbi:MAG: DUF4293 domain-containing protein [Rikenellaceae bacterium]|nr:DUF4293 domain-containing protein [Rikenellaceae bacterium]
MIQRIQSIYLLATALLLLLLFFVPTVSIDFFLGTQSRTIEMLPFGITETGGGESSLAIGTVYYGILITVAMALTLTVIFLFKNRLLQMRLVAADIVLQAGILGFIAYYIYKAYSLAENIEAVSIGAKAYVSLSPVCAVPVATIIVSCLAFRGILRDHILVRSLDRIR